MVALSRLDRARHSWAPLTVAAAMVFLIYLVIAAALVIPRFSEDAVAYYAETHSLLFDGDLDLADEYARDPAEYAPGSRAGPRAVLPRDLDGRFIHSVNAGTVVLLAPFLLLGQGLAFAGQALGLPFAADGYDRVSILAVAFGTNALVAAGLLLLVAYLRRFTGLAVALVAAGAVWLASPLFLRSIFRPGHAHALAVVLEALFVTLFLVRGRDRRDHAAWLGLGALAGLLLTVRPITGLYGVVPAAWLVGAGLVPAWRHWTAAERTLRERAREAWSDLWPSALVGLLFLVGTFLGRLPQFLLAGDFSLIGSGFYSETGYLQTAFGGDPLRGLASLLLDPRQGALIWVPLLPLSLLGLLAFWWMDRLTALACMSWAALIWVFTASLNVPERFGGLTLPSRHLIEATPVYVVGVAGVLIGGRRLGGWLASHAQGRRSQSDAAQPRAWPARAMFLLATALVAVTTLWGWAAQVSDTTITDDVPVVERLSRVATRPWVLGRLYIDAADREPVETGVFVGARSISGLLTLRSERLVEGTAALLLAGLIGAACLAAAVAGWRLMERREGMARGRSTATARARPARAGPAIRAARRPAWSAWAAALIPWLVVLAVLTPLTTERLLAPTTVQAGERLAIRDWRLRDDLRPGGVVLAAIYGQSASGNQVLVPPLPQGASSSEDRSTVTRGTFAPLVHRREATFVPPPEWDALGEILLWFGPTFDRDTAAEVRAGPASLGAAGVSHILGAEELALGAVRVALPLRLDRIGSPIRLEVRSVPGHPAPEVSVHGDGSLAFLPYGVAGRKLPEVTIGGQRLLSEIGPRARLPEASTLRLERDGGSQLRLGPWGAESLLRWSQVGSAWRLPGPTSVSGTWSDSTVPDSSPGLLVLRLDAPAAIREATAHLLYTAYEPSVPQGRITLEASSDGLDYVLLHESIPVSARRIAQLAATYRPARDARSVWFRITVDTPPGATIGLNGGWFDAALEMPELSSRLAASSDQVAASFGGAAGRATPVTMEIGTPPGRLSAPLYALADLMRSLIAALGASGTLLLTVLLAGAALLLGRRGMPLAAGSLFGVAIVCALTTIVLLPHVTGGG